MDKCIRMKIGGKLLRVCHFDYILEALSIGLSKVVCLLDGTGGVAKAALPRQNEMIRENLEE